MSEITSVSDKYQDRFNRTIANTLSVDQENQSGSAPVSSQREHRVSVKNDNADIRLSFGLFYLVIMFGKEKRSEERLARDRKKYPLFTQANIRAIIFTWLLIFFVGLFAQLTLY